MRTKLAIVSFLFVGIPCGWAGADKDFEKANKCYDQLSRSPAQVSLAGKLLFASNYWPEKLEDQSMLTPEESRMLVEFMSREKACHALRSKALSKHRPEHLAPFTRHNERQAAIDLRLAAGEIPVGVRNRQHMEVTQEFNNEMRGLFSSAVATAAPQQAPKKGGFWKKLGQGVLVGLAAYAVAEAAVNDSPAATETQANAQRASQQGVTQQAVYTNPSAFDTSINGWGQQSGGVSFYNFSNGVTGSSQRIGNSTFHNLSNGLSGSSLDIGNSTFHNFNNGVSGSSLGIGNSTFHNFNNGVSGSGQKIGNSTFTNYSNGTSCTETQIGSMVTTNCQGR